MAIYLKVVDGIKNGSCEGCWFDEGFRCDEINHYGEKYFDCSNVNKIAVPATPEEIKRYKQKILKENEDRILYHLENDPDYAMRTYGKTTEEIKEKFKKR